MGGGRETTKRVGRPPLHTAEQRAEMRRLWEANPDRGQPGYLSLARIGELTGGWTAKVVFSVINPDGRADLAREWDMARQPVGPDEHKRARRTLGLERVEDLLALTKRADPFYCGMASQNRDAQWFGRLWRELDFPDDSHLRRVLADDDGEGWEGWTPPRLEVPSAELAMPSVAVSGYEYRVADQPVLLEVWAEKSTMDDILHPLCLALGVNYLPGTGYESFSKMVSLLRRAESYLTKRAAVLYVSDHDKAGINMPVQVSRQLQFFAVQLGIGAEVFVEPIILTAEQVERYGLPEAPQEEGSDAVKTELDALEALHPGELARIVESAVERWRDPELAGRLDQAEQVEQNNADAVWEQDTGQEAAELERVGEDITAILAEVQPVIDAANQRLADGPGRALEALAGRVRMSLQSETWELAERPTADAPEALDDTDGLLYDSNRDWLEQVQAYRRQQGKPPLDIELTVIDPPLVAS
jgi:hypothetical protein